MEDDIDSAKAMRAVADAITHKDEAYISSPEGEEALRKIANAFNQMHAAAAQKNLQKMLNVAEQDIPYADNRAGRRAQAKAKKTKGSKQRRLDKKAAAWLQRTVK